MNKFKVPIKNALFMYSYIWDKVDNKDYISLSSEDDFESANIYAELFLINIKKILKRGLYKEYVLKNEELKVVKGKVDFVSTINNQSIKNGKIYCDFDELEENNIFNQILKYTALRLYKSSKINDDNKKRLNRVLLYFNQVEFKELTKESFDRLNFNKSNYYYFFMIKICELIFKAQMLSEETGKYVFYDLFNSDDNMNKVFELFVYKFYEHELNKNEHHLDKKFSVSYQSQLNWNITGGDQSYLPKMNMDTLIKSDDETIVMDTKYYKEYFSTYYEKDTFISANMYQMMAYLNNINVINNLRGILLYPLPKDANPINEIYNVKVVSEDQGMVDAKIQFVTIDLSKDWRDITFDLLNIVDKDIATKKKIELSSI